MHELLLVLEGHGEVQAAPVLVRRVLGELHGIYPHKIETHRRGGLAHLRANDWAHFRRYLPVAFMERMPVLWMVDNDEGVCARTLLQEMYKHAKSTGIQQRLAFCFWYREYETMFLYDPANVAKMFGIENFVVPNNPDDSRAAKGIISRAMPSGYAYKETINQSQLSAVIDLELVRNRYKSFQHFERALKWLAADSAPEIYPLAV
ncbi:MAG: DUF4276 family protein [Pseudomonadota bacterium]